MLDICRKKSVKEASASSAGSYRTLTWIITSLVSFSFVDMKLDDRIKWLDDYTHEYLRLIEEADKEEDSEGTLIKEELEAKLTEAQERLEKYRSYREIMEKKRIT